MRTGVGGGGAKGRGTSRLPAECGPHPGASVISNFLNSLFTVKMISVKGLQAIDLVSVSFGFGLDCSGLFQ